jgi:hypothetical protein
MSLVPNRRVVGIRLIELTFKFSFQNIKCDSRPITFRSEHWVNNEGMGGHQGDLIRLGGVAEASRVVLSRRREKRHGEDQGATALTRAINRRSAALVVVPPVDRNDRKDDRKQHPVADKKGRLAAAFHNQAQ